jgi:hypothetical protein
MRLGTLPGVAGTSSLANTWVDASVDASMVFFLSPSLQYSRLFHPDQYQRCKINFPSIFPISADDAQRIEEKNSKNPSNQSCPGNPGRGENIASILWANPADASMVNRKARDDGIGAS